MLKVFHSLFYCIVKDTITLSECPESFMVGIVFMKYTELFKLNYIAHKIVHIFLRIDRICIFIWT